jgi:hypothetical protein
MVKLTRNDILKIQILEQFKKKEIDYTASYLSEILRSKFETISKALEFYFCLGIVEKDIKEHGKKKITYFSLTELGKNLIKSEKIN